METLQRFLVHMFVCLFLSGCSDAFIPILANLDGNCCLLLHCLLIDAVSNVLDVILIFSLWERSEQKTIFLVLLPFTLNHPTKELGEYEFQAKMCGRVQLQCPKAEQPDSEIQPLFLFYQCGLKKSQAASFAKPEIWLTLLLVVSHATGRAVVGWGWGLQFWNLWRTVSCLPDFPHAGWKWVLVLGLSVVFSSCWLFT